MRRMAEEKAAPVYLEKYPWEKVLSLTETQRLDIRPLQEAFQENLGTVREKRATESITSMNPPQQKSMFRKNVALIGVKKIMRRFENLW